MGNLKHFKPGQSGNPKGKPKGTKMGVRAQLRHLLKKQVTPEIEETLKKLGIKLSDRSNASGVAHALIDSAQRGDVSATRLILDHTELPLALENVEDGGAGFPSITVNFVRGKAGDNVGGD